MTDDPKNPKRISAEESERLTADLERMRSGGKPDIRGNPAAAAGSPLNAMIHHELNTNPEALRTLEALKAAGVQNPTALMGQAMYRSMYEVTRGMPERWPAVILALREGRTLEELFPDGLYEGGGASN